LWQAGRLDWCIQAESLIELQFFRILKITPLNRTGAAGRGSSPPLVSLRLACGNVFLIQDRRFKPEDSLNNHVHQRRQTVAAANVTQLVSENCLKFRGRGDASRNATVALVRVD
jgi:hypothetical protein